MNDRTKRSETGAFEFVIRRTFNAPRARVWQAWTDPDQLLHWWGPKGFKVVSTKVDLRPGGMFHYCLESPQGQVMWGRFLYREIVPEERLVYINSFSDPEGGVSRHPLHEGWPLQIFSTVTFAERDGKTTVTIHWVPYEATEAERDTFEEGAPSMQAGWTGTLDRLEDYLAKA
ncbi:MAG: SRPBCC family protein [Methyloceanibacter sp.]|uniref:SRPBCC family protein n=1 Tax=Methyloceanibacter sp. TaxID=1965321 RepID=UPI003D6C7A21